MNIEKNQRINTLFDFYAVLLTQKQMNYIELYYVDDLSLSEIAEQFEVSRQAVYDNIKRTEKVLEDFEKKLGLYSNYVVRDEIIEDLLGKYPQDEYLQTKLQELNELEQ
ncbi:MAG: putative DNA-binding protein [Lactobacillales bacterium]|jgi:predicted DNA-binding protein YlxM (UPF0122 family)|nr:putative DNA-binding protein [Lactobacillales bacterium]